MAKGETWNQMSVAEQMATIGEEAERVIKSLQNGEWVSLTEYGSMKTVLRGFERCKRDPKNSMRILELEEAEKSLVDVVTMKEKMSKEELEEKLELLWQYWRGWLHAYCNELENRIS